jgi:hypothetical protein
MDRHVKRILAYMLLAAVLYAVATFLTVSQTAFVMIFGTGLVIGIAADLMFLTHLVRLPWRRRNQDG